MPLDGNIARDGRQACAAICSVIHLIDKVIPKDYNTRPITGKRMMSSPKRPIVEVAQVVPLALLAFADLIASTSVQPVELTLLI